ncbi:MAG: hypothetical protein M1456_01685 [Actinobacteria bacterium]|jgi:hypothetical protein|nr:hypothetical protein [Actinomycetota bacterium]
MVDEVNWDIVLAFCEAQNNMSNIICYSTDTTLNNLDDSDITRLFVDNMLKCLRDHGVEAANLQKNSIDTAKDLFNRDDIKLAQYASGIVNNVLIHANYMSIGEITSELRQQIADGGLSIGDDEVDHIAMFIYEFWQSENNSHYAERATIVRSAGKSIPDIVQDLKAQRAKFGLPELPEDELRRTAERIYTFRNHPLKIIGLLAHSAVDIIKILRQAGNNKR